MHVFERAAAPRHAPSGCTAARIQRLTVARVAAGVRAEFLRIPGCQCPATTEAGRGDVKASVRVEPTMPDLQAGSRAGFAGKWRDSAKVPTHSRLRRAPVGTLGPLCGLPTNASQAILASPHVPQSPRFAGHLWRVKKKAPVGVEPTMADLQSAALATWLRRRFEHYHTLGEFGATGQVVPSEPSLPDAPAGAVVPLRGSIGVPHAASSVFTEQDLCPPPTKGPPWQVPRGTAIVSAFQDFEGKSPLWPSRQRVTSD